MFAFPRVCVFFQAATKSDSMTLTPGPWLGLPAVPAATLYRHADPALVSVLILNKLGLKPPLTNHKAPTEPHPSHRRILTCKMKLRAVFSGVDSSYTHSEHRCNSEPSRTVTGELYTQGGVH